MLAQLVSLVRGMLSNSLQPKPESTVSELVPTIYFRWTRGEDKVLSSHFFSHEFECKCGCGPQIISKELVAKLENVRQSLGSAVHITSGYRCKKFQEKLRGLGFETAVGVSQHELGNAADISCLDKSKMIQLQDLCEREFDALGAGASFLHVDTRKDKIRRWTYGR